MNYQINGDMKFKKQNLKPYSLFELVDIDLYNSNVERFNCYVYKEKKNNINKRLLHNPTQILKAIKINSTYNKKNLSQHKYIIGLVHSFYVIMTSNT